MVASGFVAMTSVDITPEKGGEEMKGEGDRRKEVEK
uniref:Uncharacterized protein n=1 Tax=Candidatus Methanophagaceae archaeon ANME-1 ERB6 TaxID=2759912 RepID=A0A7G9YS53_9EURY|nr:hypothetical protein CMPLHDHG_00002 [Methanosarcinales archaeon ANME-1 ERB6]